jgi:tetratricopeptide (TPR) repeat protein
VGISFFKKYGIDLIARLSHEIEEAEKMKALKKMMVMLAGVSLLLVGTQVVAMAQAAQAQAPAQAKAPQAKTTEEYNAYSALFKEADLAKKAELAEKFLASFPESDFKPYIFQTIIDCYLRLGNKEKVISTGEKFETDMPQADPNIKKFMFQRQMQAYQLSNNPEKTIEYGEKILALDPNDLPALLTLCAVLPERLPQDEAKRAAQLDSGLTYSQKALDLINAIPKPAQLSDEQWNSEKNKLVATVTSSQALVYLNKKDYPKAAETYEKSTGLVKTNPIDFYRLGIAYSLQARATAVELNKVVQAQQGGQAPAAGAPTIDDLKKKFEEFRDKAVSTLAKSVVLKGPTEAQAKTELEKLYKTKNNDSLDGLDAVLAKASEGLK